MSCAVLVASADRLTFALDTDASEEQRASLLKLTERYRVVLQTASCFRRSAPRPR